MNTTLPEALARTLGAGFRIDRELGGGGMSRVFLATDLALDRQVVVKVLSTELSAGVSADRFRREIQLVAKLQHPHVVPILSAGDAEGALYYVMPWISGESLRARIAREGPMPVNDTVRILRETLDALAFAHAQGVIHRDIKPDNILVSAGHAVVADFGVSKALQDSSASTGPLTSVGIALGTPAYMAPEQAAADPATDHRADLYSVGVVAYEMLAGAPPFAGTPSQLLKAQLAEAPAPVKQRRSDIPDSLADLIMRALEKDPARRPQGAREMIAELDGVAAPADAVGRSRASRRGPSTALMVGGAAVVILGGGVALYASRSPVIRSAQSLAITPFSVADGDTALVRLGQNLVTTMSANLDGVGEIRVADAMAVLSHAKAKGVLLSIAEAVDIARKLGARSVVYGTLAKAGPMVRADMALYDIDAPAAPVVRVSASLPVDSVSALTDSLTWGLLREVWAKGRAPTPNATSIRTRSPAALREFLEGERMFARGAIEEATTAYTRAVQADTTFWFAHYRYRVARDWFGLPRDTAITQRLTRHLHELPERERLLILAIDSSTSQSDRLQKTSALLARYPDYAPALLSYADDLSHHAGRSGHEAKEAIAPWRRITELMPTDMESAAHLVWGYITSGDAVGARAAAAQFDSLVRKQTKVGWLPIVQQGTFELVLNPSTPARLDSLDRESARDSLFRGGLSVNLIHVSLLLGDHPSLLRDRDELVRRHAARLKGSAKADFLALERFGMFIRGDVQSIGAAQADPGFVPSQPFAAAPQVQVRQFLLRTQVLSEIQGLIPAEMATVTTALGALNSPELTSAMKIELHWMAAASALVRGDSSVVRAQLSELLRDTTANARIAVRSLRGIALGRGGKTAAAAESLLVLERDHGEHLPKVWGAFGADRLLAAQWLTDAQRYAPADSLLRFTEGYTITATNETAGLVLAAALLQRSRIAEGVGNKAAALRFAESFIVLYDHAPPAAKPQLDEARQRVARLGGGADFPRSRAVP